MGLMISKSLIEGAVGLAAGAMLGSLGDNGGMRLPLRSRKLVSVEVESAADSVGDAPGLSLSLSRPDNLVLNSLCPGEIALSRARLDARLLLKARDAFLEGE